MDVNMIDVPQTDMIQPINDPAETQQRKLDHLKKGWGDEVGAAAEWVVQNRHLFEKEIFGPLGMLLSCNNQRYVDAVEYLTRPAFITFIAQTQHDKELLERYLEPPPECKGWSLRIPVWFEESPTIVPSPLSREKLVELHFEGYVSDFLEYPPEVHNYVASQLRLHEIPITMEDYSNVEYNDAADALGYAGGDTYVDGPIIACVEKLYTGTPVVVDLCEYPQAQFLCL